jgi:hypothetical protein
MKHIVKLLASLLPLSFMSVYVCVHRLAEPYRETALSEADATFATVFSRVLYLFWFFCLFQVIVRL